MAIFPPLRGEKIADQKTLVKEGFPDAFSGLSF
jgi:hypothetical protein